MGRAPPSSGPAEVARLIAGEVWPAFVADPDSRTAELELDGDATRAFKHRAWAGTTRSFLHRGSHRGRGGRHRAGVPRAEPRRGPGVRNHQTDPRNPRGSSLPITSRAKPRRGGQDERRERSPQRASEPTRPCRGQQAGRSASCGCCSSARRSRRQPRPNGVTLRRPWQPVNWWPLSLVRPRGRSPAVCWRSRPPAARRGRRRSTGTPPGSSPMLPRRPWGGRSLSASPSPTVPRLSNRCCWTP